MKLTHNGTVLEFNESEVSFGVRVMLGDLKIEVSRIPVENVSKKIVWDIFIHPFGSAYTYRDNYSQNANRNDKIPIIKLIREHFTHKGSVSTICGLGEAKSFVEGTHIIAEGPTNPDQSAFLRKLRNEGVVYTLYALPDNTTHTLQFT